MRIGINGQLLREKNTGVEYCISDLTQALADIDADIEYVVYVNRGFARNNGDRGKQFVTKKTKFPIRTRLIRILWEQTCLPFHCIKDKIDLIHAPGYVMPVFSSIPVVVTIPDVIALRFPYMCKTSNYLHYRLLMPSAARKAERIITMSHNTKKDIVETLKIREDKIDVIYPGIQPMFLSTVDASRRKQVRVKYGLPEKFLLFVGNLEPKKNIERIIDAFAVLKNDWGIEHALVIAGKKSWSYDGIFKKVGQANMSRHVIFLGYVPRDDLPPLYTMADVFIFPSLYEGFGIPPLEAMACGTPVVVSNVSSLPEVVGNAGIKVDPRDVREIADGIRKIITYESLKRQLIIKGLKRARMFCWRKTARATLEVYRKAFYGHS